MSHCDTCHWYNRDTVPLTYDPCSRRYRRSICNYFRRKLVERERISKKCRGALVGLSIAQLDPFGSVENLIRNRSCPTSCTYFSGWKCLPAKTITFLCHLTFKWLFTDRYIHMCFILRKQIFTYQADVFTLGRQFFTGSRKHE